jgi:hypothetical protein
MNQTPKRSAEMHLGPNSHSGVKAEVVTGGETPRLILINEARRTRNMGSTLEIEDRTNPVEEFRCQKCWQSEYKRRFAASGTWPYHCQEPMSYRGVVPEMEELEGKRI